MVFRSSFTRLNIFLLILLSFGKECFTKKLFLPTQVSAQVRFIDLDDHEYFTGKTFAKIIIDHAKSKTPNLFAELISIDLNGNFHFSYYDGEALYKLLKRNPSDPIIDPRLPDNRVISVNYFGLFDADATFEEPLIWINSNSDLFKDFLAAIQNENLEQKLAAKLKIAQRFKSGEDVPGNLAYAIDLLENISEQDFFPKLRDIAIYELATIFYNTQIEGYFPTAKTLFNQIKDSGHLSKSMQLTAKFILANMYHRGQGGPTDLGAAKKLYQDVVNQDVIPQIRDSARYFINLIDAALKN